MVESEVKVNKLGHTGGFFQETLIPHAINLFGSALYLDGARRILEHGLERDIPSVEQAGIILGEAVGGSVILGVADKIKQRIWFRNLAQPAESSSGNAFIH